MKNLTDEVRAERMKEAMESRGIDYDAYVISIRDKKQAKLDRKHGICYRPNHEDNVQFGCCAPDTCDCLVNSF